MDAAQDNDLQGYKVQGIFYRNKRTHRIQQNVGGTCPLLALGNVLFLNQNIYYTQVDLVWSRIKGEDLTNCLSQHLQNMLLNSNDESVKTELVIIKSDDFNDNDFSFDWTSNAEQNDKTTQTINNDNVEQTEEEKKLAQKLKKIDEFAPLFSKLEQTLNVNIKFSDVCDFERNAAYELFNYFGIQLYHAFVVDPQQQNLYNLIANKSYNEATDFLISEPHKDATEHVKKQLKENKNIVRNFLAECSQQVTEYGLKCLDKSLEEDKLAILFRQDHFGIIVKRDGLLYEFVTDEGVIEMDPQITWQTFFWGGTVDFVNNKFQPIHVQFAKLGKPMISLQSRRHHYMSGRHMQKTPYAVGLLVDRYVRRIEHDVMNGVEIPHEINRMLYTYLLYEYFKLLDAKIWISLVIGECVSFEEPRIFFEEPLMKQLADGNILYKLINKIKTDEERGDWIGMVRALHKMKIDVPCGMNDVFCNLYAVTEIIHNLSRKAKENGFEGPFIDTEIIYALRNSYGLCVMTKTTKSLYELL